MGGKECPKALTIASMREPDRTRKKEYQGRRKGRKREDKSIKRWSGQNVEQGKSRQYGGERQ